jgi:hypothetical protein
VDDHEVTEEGALDDRVHDGGAHSAPVPTYADDRDPVWAQQRGQRGGLRLRLAGVGGAERGLGHPGVHLDGDHAAVELAGDLEAGVGEHADHGAVLGQHLRGEAAYAGGPGGGREVLEQEGADAVPPERVGDQEGDLGLVAEALGGGQAHQGTALPQTEGEHLPAVVLGQQVVDVGVAGRPAGAEEAEPQALQPDLVVQGEERVAVGEAEGADDTHGAVGQQDVCGRGRWCARQVRVGARDVAGDHGSSSAHGRRRP